MEASGSNVPKCDEEEKALKGLLDAFSTTFSLDEIASAYCKAGRNADLAAEVLFDMQGSTPTSATYASNGEAKGEESLESSSGNFSEKLGQASGNSRASKPKSRSVSGGTVSSILGEDYIRSTPSANGSCKVSKPISKVWRVASRSELSEVEVKSGSPKDARMHQDMEDLAAEDLFDMQGSNSTSVTCVSNGEAKGEESLESSCGNFSEKLGQASGNSRASKPKSSVSGGSVSSILGKDYIRSIPSANGPCNVSKPIRKVWRVVQMSELSEVEAKSGAPKDEPMRQDMADLLFRMLGDGFKLDRDLILQVLDYCGYDMQECMDKLLDLSGVTLDKRNNFVGESTEKFTDMGSKVEVLSHERKLQYINHPGSNGHGVEPFVELKEKNDLQKEVLVALFNAPESRNEFPRRTKAVKRRAALEQVVDETSMDFNIDQNETVMYLQKDNEDDEDEGDGYQVLRRAWKEYRGTMKEYIQAAVDAISKRDHVRAEKLLQQAYFFGKKAREADEESNRINLESRNVEAEDEMLLDLHDLGAKEAVRLLKCHLSSLWGIPSLKHLKVIIETNDEDITKGSRRKLVVKLLEKESIKWTEEGNAGTILIRMDNINKKRLSFVKK
ncbi:putative nuclear RNA export factor SDE5 [Corylus avellana]|uniref:putative nuclear RNA export factor SDE5 n=1 Tax=Corylus avellana TaxID=13451 RepID=UPI00286D1362|nr:putative nuclear RNA export factor SDE5 [Corylus avellana]XP_059436180.1 putative nuclear RNA export factor SDE5 [Corylus avellana]